MNKMMILTISMLCCTVGQNGLYACDSCHKCTSCHVEKKCNTCHVEKKCNKCHKCDKCDSGCMSWLKFWEWGCNDCGCKVKGDKIEAEKVEAAPAAEPAEIKVEEGMEK